ncbi:MAG: tRNA (guanosine(46)-N7)-methyltransferase TrmB [Deltaproteobacteria bacterium]|nr:tRNA (guanosine(46)-N7)-methyltransferase TrmB [Deltaproteobacteria bacterium]
MARRVRHHVNPMTFLHLTSDAQPLAIPDHMPVDVDLGSGEGEFLLSYGAQRANRFVVGIEIRRALVNQTNERAIQSGIQDHVVALYANLNHDLPLILPEGRADSVWMQFPDPWFKRRHQKRRALANRLGETVFHLLQPGGWFFFQSDVFELALEAMADMEAHPVFRNDRGPWTFLRHNPLPVPTRRERYCLEKRIRIWRLSYHRIDGPS